jgi:NADPH-dependent glutamate synthase beta subunit-like oxidoreductase
MPANAEEVDAAEREGVRIIELAAPERIDHNGRLSVTCRRMKLGEPDASGRPRPLPTEETFVIAGDHLIAAIGQSSALPATALGGVATDRWGLLQAGADNGATDDPFVFAGGDAVTGPSSVAEALQGGKYAAFGIDRELADDRQKVIVEAWRDRDAWLAEPRYQPVDVAKAVRRHAPALPPAEAIHSFNEVEGALAPADAIAEAQRCLACGYCATCRNCLDNFGCPAFYLENGQVQINPILCDGCGVCVQVCPNGAIVPLQSGA